MCEMLAFHSTVIVCWVVVECVNLERKLRWRDRIRWSPYLRTELHVPLRLPHISLQIHLVEDTIVMGTTAGPPSKNHNLQLTALHPETADCADSPLVPV